jgi:hypothetical protein
MHFGWPEFLMLTHCEECVLRDHSSVAIFTFANHPFIVLTTLSIGL